jgi:hypothetical protein
MSLKLPGLQKGNAYERRQNHLDRLFIIGGGAPAVVRLPEAPDRGRETRQGAIVAAP